MNLFKEKNIKLNPDEFRKLLIGELKSIKNLELLILKSHLLVEYLLNSFIETHSNSDEFSISETSFQFHHKLKICMLFGVFENKNDEKLQQILLLNKIRNHVSHTLIIDKTLVENFLKYSDQKEEYKKPYSDQDIIKMFKQLIIYLCGYLVGTFQVQIQLENELKQRGLNNL
jgi:hypothetical protein